MYVFITIIDTIIHNYTKLYTIIHHIHNYTQLYCIYTLTTPIHMTHTHIHTYLSPYTHRLLRPRAELRLPHRDIHGHIRIPRVHIQHTTIDTIIHTYTPYTHLYNNRHNYTPYTHLYTIYTLIHHILIIHTITHNTYDIRRLPI
jgi:hypothetical protein